MVDTERTRPGRPSVVAEQNSFVPKVVDLSEVPPVVGEQQGSSSDELGENREPLGQGEGITVFLPQSVDTPLHFQQLYLPIDVVVKRVVFSPEQIAVQQKLERERVKHREAQRRYQQRNPEKHRESVSKWYQNPDVKARKAAYSRAYQQRPEVKERLEDPERRESRREYNREYQRKRRVAKRAVQQGDSDKDQL